MENDYLIVSTAILPKEYEKVIEARELLQTQACTTITEAVRRCGISRNTYYKYRDYVFRPGEKNGSRKIILSLILKNETGALSQVLQVLSRCDASVITISQSAPAAHRASVILALDISALKKTVADMMKQMRQIRAVEKVHLDSME
jgi:chorismate mutase